MPLIKGNALVIVLSHALEVIITVVSTVAFFDLNTGQYGHTVFNKLKGLGTQAMALLHARVSRAFLNERPATTFARNRFSIN